MQIKKLASVEIPIKEIPKITTSPEKWEVFEEVLEKDVNDKEYTRLVSKGVYIKDFLDQKIEVMKKELDYLTSIQTEIEKLEE